MNTDTRYILTTTTKNLYIAVTEDGRRLEILTNGNGISVTKETKQDNPPIKKMKNKTVIPPRKKEISTSNSLEKTIESYIQTYIRNSMNTDTRYILTTTTKNLYIAVTEDGRRLEILTNGNGISVTKETKQDNPPIKKLESKTVIPPRKKEISTSALKQMQNQTQNQREIQDNYFGCLKDKWEELYNLAASAQENVFNDANISLIKLRMFGEKLVSIIFTEERITVPSRTSQEEKLHILGRSGILNDIHLGNLHEIRVIGNIAVHEGHSSIEDAKRLLVISKRLSDWIVKRYN
ncbi:DUF4145 domain-containing protein [Neobacillus sp. YIM B06451]|uniref:DUF4145 domain-containing protein n=1 Tax=Neobacillus sp. YIM B06451 TaxID=3070994 RepID=UPI00292DE141|nr:DUF4145 domain-containing protein [Neobacillus sp. YIM B06451]